MSFASLPLANRGAKRRLAAARPTVRRRAAPSDLAAQMPCFRPC
ncbi:MAG TPA: hypothetical protein VNK91_13015 [Burkholderiaceae bacterium]|jgi:hypothetical protein|nr:hypothetical protein [Burkholderiaceae bacterium]